MSVRLTEVGTRLPPCFFASALARCTLPSDGPFDGSNGRSSSLRLLERKPDRKDGKREERSLVATGFSRQRSLVNGRRLGPLVLGTYQVPARERSG